VCEHMPLYPPDRDEDRLSGVPLSTTDGEIRRYLKQDLLSTYSNDPDTVIIEELGLRHGYCRVDLAVVNGSLHGFEIKSDRDTFRRLSRQADTYNRVFDFVTLVTGERHADSAMRIAQPWWGIQVAGSGRGSDLRLLEVRKPSENPLPDKLAITKLLWREEALTLLEELGAASGVRSKPRRHVYSRLAEAADLDVVRARVRRQLKSRLDWRSGGQRKSGDD
jgi:hypothetical protein